MLICLLILLHLIFILSLVPLLSLVMDLSICWRLLLVGTVPIHLIDMKSVDLVQAMADFAGGWVGTFGINLKLECKFSDCELKEVLTPFKCSQDNNAATDTAPEIRAAPIRA